MTPISDSRRQVEVSSTIYICIVVIGTVYLSSRYYTSAALEHPILFSTSTLFWVGLGLAGCATWLGTDQWGSRPHIVVLPSRLRLLPSRLFVPCCCIVARTILLALTIQWTQCSSEGLFDFLPALLALQELRDTFGPRRFPLPRLQDQDDPDASPKTETNHSWTSRSGYGNRRAVFGFLISTVVWGFMIRKSLILTESANGAVCPANTGWARMVPGAQALMLLLDAVILLHIARLRRRHSDGGDQPSSWTVLAAASLNSAWVLLALLCLTTLHPRRLESMGWALNHPSVLLKDVLLDSAVVATVLFASVMLLTVMRPAIVALLIGAVSIHAHHFNRLTAEGSTLHVSHQTDWSVVTVGLVAIMSLFGAIRFDANMADSVGMSDGLSRLLQRRLVALLSVMVAALATCSLVMSTRLPPGLVPLMRAAWTDSEAWITQASKSTTLGEAVVEYEKRYGIMPPPHFDKWYHFATDRGSAIIDSFDQIFQDTLPFWGVSPAVLRERTSHLLEQTKLGIGGFRIKNGTVVLSPHTPGTHFWMMEGFKAMVEPFLQWLPDMDLVFNLDDECRVVIPFEDLQLLIKDGLRSRERLAAASNLRGFSESQDPPWAEQYLQPDFKEKRQGKTSPAFNFRTETRIYDGFIAPTCPRKSRARSERWWCPKAALPEGRGLVRNWLEANDLCARPDIARMHGFLLDPGSFAVTRILFPFFSQSRVPGFNDILVPSPWNFMSKVDLDAATDQPWNDKLNSVFWRGGSSDGLSTHSSWTGYLRARFVHMANSAPVLPWSGKVAGVDSSATPLFEQDGIHGDGDYVHVNVTFVGNFTKCQETDCREEAATFYGGKRARPAASVGFQEHWRHRHLVDLDGAGFSGRFLSFLKSRSLVYRASLFRTWYDERVHAWRHFVPLDISLAELWKLTGFFGGGHGPTTAVEDDRQVSYGERIAEEGREWALRTLRKEDMQVYMFRLLLEWGRLLDDAREELGYS